MTDSTHEQGPDTGGVPLEQTDDPLAGYVTRQLSFDEAEALGYDGTLRDAYGPVYVLVHPRDDEKRRRMFGEVVPDAAAYSLVVPPPPISVYIPFTVTGMVDAETGDLLSLNFAPAASFAGNLDADPYVLEWSTDGAVGSDDAGDLFPEIDAAAVVREHLGGWWHGPAADAIRDGSTFSDDGPITWHE
jgi:hypothetical protein